MFPFRGVSGFVALQEEMFRQRAGAALFAVVLHLVFQNIAGAQQPFGAVQLQALVVTVRGAAAVDDGRHRAGGIFQNDKRGIDIPRLANRRIHQVTALGIHRHRLFAHDETGHVEVVNGHIAEHAAGDAHVLRGRRRRVAGDDQQRFRLADAPGLGIGFHAAELWVKAAVKADEQRHVVLFNHFQAVAHAGEVEVYRLFAEDSLAVAGGHFNQIRVGVGGGGDQHGVNVRVGHRLIHALLADLILCGETGGKFLIRVNHGPERGRAVAGDVSCMYLANSASAQ